MQIKVINKKTGMIDYNMTRRFNDALRNDYPFQIPSYCTLTVGKIKKKVAKI